MLFSAQYCAVTSSSKRSRFSEDDWFWHFIIFCRKAPTAKANCCVFAGSTVCRSFRHFTKCAEHVGSWEVTVKKTCFFFYPLPFLISFPAVSMATKSLSVGSLCADVVTSIKPLSPSSVSLSVKLPSPPCDKQLTVNLTQHSLIQTTGSFFTP